MATNSTGRWKPRYDKYDMLPPELRQFLQNSYFNWGTEFVARMLDGCGDPKKVLRSMRSREAHRIKRDARLVWRR